ncbi:MAG: cation-translocating P-type ATPase, partial [Chitinophagaceae bacterium]
MKAVSTTNESTSNYPNWHLQSTQLVLENLKTNENGLTDAAVKIRINQYGLNTIRLGSAKPAWKILVAQFTDVMIVILMVAALISGIMGDIADTVVILLIVVINALIGFIQELKAEKAMNALKQMAEIKATVIRDSITQIIDAPNIVPGDILLLEAGNAVPADARLIATYGLKIEEAALTGESFAIEKKHLPLAKSQTYTLGELTNMAFKGTFVTAGRAKAVVVSTGMQTELGKIAAMLQEADVMTPLQQRMQLFGKKLSVIVLLLCLLFLLIGWLRNEPIIQLLLTSISLAVAAIPEALPAVITISLALAAKRMIAFNSLIRKLPAVETLGSVTYICTDKTGTLTKNKMFVEALLLKEKAFNITEWKAIGFEQMEQQLLLNAMFSNNDAYQNNNGIWLGDSTEVALKELAVSCNNNYAALERVGEIAFDSDRKLMTTFHIYGNRIIAFTKGAPDILLEKCINNHGIYTASIDAFAAEGYRLIGFAYRIWDSLPTTLNAEKCETQLNFLGVAGLIDPPREEVFEAVHKCLKAGIVPVMITGDHPLTAETIARRIGIMTLPTDKVISGKELATLSDNDLQNQIKHIKVFARVSPEQKLQIVKCLQAQGEFVAMTGDGVNDAPSLKRANIGIAMGITGTDVSKEAADMILLDDNFSTIVKAIEEG